MDAYELRVVGGRAGGRRGCGRAEGVYASLDVSVCQKQRRGRERKEGGRGGGRKRENAPQKRNRPVQRYRYSSARDVGGKL